MGIALGIETSVMLILNFVLALLFQTPQAATPPPPQSTVPATAGQTVIVGLEDGMKVAVENPEFSGFIDGRSGDAVLLYRERAFHGEMRVRTIAKIEFGPYKRGKPFPLKVTLRNGDQLEVETERRDFVSIKGRTDFGTVTIKHPDPISAPVRLTTKKPNRKGDLTIQYLEFPAS